jgi:hypothetical protein
MRRIYRASVQVAPSAPTIAQTKSKTEATRPLRIGLHSFQRQGRAYGFVQCVMLTQLFGQFMRHNDAYNEL